MQSAARERLTGLAAFAAPLLLYAITAHRFVGFWDTGEMDTVPYILGIAHPPGLPLYTLAGWVFSHVVPIGSVAWRMSLFSACAMSAAAYLVYRVARELRAEPLAALAAALLFAGGDVVWSVATRADVHAFEAPLFLGTLFFAMRWFDAPSPKRAYVTAAAFGLAVAAHPVGLFLIVPVLMLIVGRMDEIDAKALPLSVVFFALSAATWFLYLPLRSAYVTAMHLDPSAALGMPGGAFWDYGHPVVASNLIHLVFASDVDVASALHGYGSDSFVDGVASFAARTVREFAVAGIVIALVGVWIAWRRVSWRSAAVLAAGAAPALFACSFGDESDVSRYFIPAFAAAAAFAGVAAGARWITAVLFALVVALVALQPQHFADANDRTALDQTSYVLAHTPDSAVIVSGWTLAPALAYRAYVDRAAGNRTILASWYGEVADVLGSWDPRRPVYVAGPPQGSVPGYRLERLSAYPQLYRVERTTAKL